MQDLYPGLANCLMESRSNYLSEMHSHESPVAGFIRMPRSTFVFSTISNQVIVTPLTK